MKKIDLTNQRFGRLTVIKESGKSKDGRILWECKCDCGNIKEVQGKLLRNGNTKSCGCFQKEMASKSSMTHGKRHTRLYEIWSDMKRRCYDKNRKCYKNYGGRGISVCPEWLHNFQAFYDWSMSHGYADDLTIDRIDNDGNYEPSNCRWTTMLEQQNNRSNNRMVTYCDETMTVAEMERKYKIHSGTLYAALDRGESIDHFMSRFLRRDGSFD